MQQQFERKNEVAAVYMYYARLDCVLILSRNDIPALPIVKSIEYIVKEEEKKEGA